MPRRKTADPMRPLADLAPDPWPCLPCASGDHAGCMGYGDNPPCGCLACHSCDRCWRLRTCYVAVGNVRVAVCEEHLPIVAAEFRGMMLADWIEGKPCAR